MTRSKTREIRTSRRAAERSRSRTKWEVAAVLFVGCVASAVFRSALVADVAVLLAIAVAGAEHAVRRVETAHADRLAGRDGVHDRMGASL